MTRLLCYTLLTFMCSTGYARVGFHKLATSSVYINHPDSSVKATVIHAPGRTKPKQGEFYYWYGNNAIHRTDGGFSGRLLHGPYTCYDPDHNLISQGQFDHGLKTGKWISWYSSGHVREIVYYSHGQAHGTNSIYDSSGNLQLRKCYRKGVRHGKTIFYSQGKIDSTICYKKGLPVPAKQCDESTKRPMLRTKKKNDSIIKQSANQKNDTISESKASSKKKKRQDSLATGEKDKSVDSSREKLKDIFRFRKKSPK